MAVSIQVFVPYLIKVPEQYLEIYHGHSFIIVHDSANKLTQRCHICRLFWRHEVWTCTGTLIIRRLFVNIRSVPRNWPLQLPLPSFIIRPAQL